MRPSFGRTIPVLRIFSVERAREFYLDWLGFSVVFEHRFEPDLPLFMGVERDGLVLHLSEHHGDGSPGANVGVETSTCSGPNSWRSGTATAARASRRNPGAPAR